jgi:uncharacterized membrane protein YkgB
MSIIERWSLLCAAAGPFVTRYGIVLVLVIFGALKWTPDEAKGIEPLILHSPVWFWLYGPLGVQGTSIFFGVFEIAAAIAIAVRPWSPIISAAGSTFCVVMFLTTLSFLFTTPGLLTSPSNGFILKDVVLLGGSLWTAAEAFAAARTRAARS